MICIESARCSGCGICVSDCFSHNIRLEGGKAQIINQDCIHCGHCVAICPDDAAAITDYDMADVRPLYETGITADGLLALIRGRRSIRQYQAKALKPGQLEKIIEAGRYTPTASNRQELTFIVIEKEMPVFRALVIEGLGELSRQTLADSAASPLLQGYARRWAAIEAAYLDDPSQNDPLFFSVPDVILIAGDNPIDVGLAASNIELVACADGLGVLYSGFITRGCAGENAKSAIGVPEGKEVLAALLVGYPDVEYQRTAPRKKADVVWR